MKESDIEVIYAVIFCIGLSIVIITASYWGKVDTAERIKNTQDTEQRSD